MTTPTAALKLARDALVYMLTEKRDYMLRNKLGNPSEESATRIANRAIAAIDALPASVPSGELADTGWLQDRGLLYRLTDERRPTNRDEIRVTMADGSRSDEACGRRAGELLALINRPTAQAAPAPAAAPGRVYLVATGETHNGLETYTRHDDAPPPLCDAERLFTAPAVAAPEPLRVAAQAVIDRWQSPRWEWSKQGSTADIMQALADALAAPTTQEPQ